MNKLILVLPLLSLEFEEGKLKTIMVGWLGMTYGVTW